MTAPTNAAMAGEEQGYATRVEPGARPKVMRRPASFGGSKPAPEPSAPAIPTIHFPDTRATTVYAEEENENLALNPPSQPSTALVTYVRPWQDDIRFGIALVSILVLVNLALIFGLPLLHRAAPVQADDNAILTMAPPVAEEDGVHVLRSPADSGPEQ